MRGLRKSTALRTGLALILIAAGIVSVVNLWRAATERPPCTAPAATPFADKITLEPMFGGVPIDKPVQLLQHPSRPDTWFVVLHRGVVERRRGNEVEIVLDISDRVGFGSQWGLQQIALHPNFPTDPRVFITYIAHGDVSTVAALHTRLDGNEVETSSEVALFREAQESPWHPVGGLRFGPDGYLYIAWGYGQLKGYDASQLRGNMLRINVDRNDNGKSYAIPADNPFIDTEYDPAVYATGLRNPWRFSFDDATGELWLGDVGEDGYEEINVISAGKDYGWPAWEGTACRRAGICAGQPGEPPLYQHTHAEMCSIIAGHFYRGRNLPALRDKYVYGDHCTGMIWALDTKSSPISSEPIGHTDFFLSSLAEDRDGELYAIVTWGFDDAGKWSDHHGRVFKIVPATRDDRSTVQAPTQSLSELGCVVPSEAGTAAPGGMIEYALNHAPWDDGAEVHRFMTTEPWPPRSGMDEMISPSPGSILLKTYLRDGRPTQTQMLTRRDDGLWAAYLYEWNEEGTDALPNPSAAAQCSRCHSRRTGTLRGLTVSQLNREFQGQNQIERLEERGTLEWSWKGDSMPALAAVSDDTASLADRARAYLDVNCASCHQPGGETGAARFDMRHSIPLAMMGLCNARPNVPLDGGDDSRLLVAGAPERSMISIRMHRSDLSAMPPQRRVVDTAGTAVVDAWIQSLTSCRPEDGSGP